MRLLGRVEKAHLHIIMPVACHNPTAYSLLYAGAYSVRSAADAKCGHAACLKRGGGRCGVGKALMPEAAGPVHSGHAAASRGTVGLDSVFAPTCSRGHLNPSLPLHPKLVGFG